MSNTFLNTQHGVPCLFYNVRNLGGSTETIRHHDVKSHYKQMILNYECLCNVFKIK